MHFLLLFAWAACVCLAITGYGQAFLNLCKLYNPPWALAGCVGIALLVGVGGFLEIAGYVRTPVLVVLMLAGDALWVRILLRDRFKLTELSLDLRNLFKINKAVPPLLFLLLAFTAIRMVGNLEPNYFQLSDDLGAYLSFPTEMLQRGSLPSDPFSERRIESALGGSYFLQTFTMVASDARSVRFIDWGFGSALYVGVVFAICRRLKVSVTGSLALALLTFVIPLRRQNVTMLVLPAALFCALFLVEIMRELDDLHRWLRPVLMGILAGAICTLKSSYLPAAALICGFYYAAEFIVKRRRSAVLQSAICALAAAFCLIPWMLDQKHKEGTYLFPLLGKGYEASAYGVIPLPGGLHFSDLTLDFWLSILPLLTPLLIAIAVQMVARRQHIETKWLEPITFFLAIGGGVGAIAYATRGDSIARYTMPFVAPGIIVFCGYAIRWRSRVKNRSVWLTGTLAVCALWVSAVAIRYGIQTYVYREYMTDLGFPPSSKDMGRFDVNLEKTRVTTLQASVPPGQPILEHLFVSYPLDFRRNPIFIADFPGLAGTPPGMPVGKGPLSLRQYLLENSIRFVAFTYGPGKFLDLTPEISLHQLMSDPGVRGRHTWLYMQNKVSCDVQTNLDTLATEYRHTYDDGEAYVLDLEVPAPVRSTSTRLSLMKLPIDSSKTWQ